MLAACRGRWRGRYVDLYTSVESDICHSGFGRTTVSRSDVCTRGNACCSPNIWQILSVFRDPAALRNQHLNSETLKTYWKKNVKLLVEKKGERIWNANTCFTAQRPHRHRLAMSLVTCMAWSSQNLGLKNRKKREKWLCLACVKMILGSSQKKHKTLQVQHMKMIHFCDNTTTSTAVAATWFSKHHHLLLKTVWFSFFNMYNFYLFALTVGYLSVVLTLTSPDNQL